MDRLQQMTVFRRVVETGNITRAARDLAMSQPSVSRLVSELEHRLGAPLLIRAPRGLRVTPAGEAFYAETVRLLDELEAAEDAVRADRTEASGQVRLAAPIVFFNKVVMPWMPAFLAAYPAVHIEAVLEDRVIDLTGEGIDLGLRVGPVRDAGLIVRRVGRLTFNLFASPDYLARAGTPASPEELTEHECCAGHVQPGPAEWTLETIQGHAVTVTVHGRFRASSVEATRLAAEAGLGIALLSAPSVAERVEAGALVPVLPTWHERSRDVSLVWPGTRHLPRRVRVLVEFLAERFGSSPLLSLRQAVPDRNAARESTRSASRGATRGAARDTAAEAAAPAGNGALADG
ncbi:LysR family transcriptional regulator [Roseomonas sp. NAR14]|uniref:LysR family transcriptional regulator n=1 Tax=Roseomonas acroporae TaxID=2937791 RepID=A0A9X1YAD1_9PROT|nr:LysR family transcriptional regulator [Roseomonas acroporae]MCK8786040.1 LysR family transcriptional regulator [Roseomonas acroporae]